MTAPTGTGSQSAGSAGINSAGVNSASALAVLRSNLASLGLDDRSTVVPGDASVHARQLDVDLVLADPPYDTPAGLWTELLDELRAPFVVAESADQVVVPSGWEIVRAKRYGRTWVTFLERI